MRQCSSRRNNQTNGGMGGDDESDPDRHYFNRGLGRLDDDDSAEGSADEEDEYEASRAQNGSGKVGRVAHIESAGGKLVTDTGETRLIGPNAQGMPFPPQRPPQPSYDIRSFRGAPYSAAAGLSSEGGEESESEFEEDHPEADARYEWQHMLSNVLQGEVLKNEKTRIAGTLTNDLDDSTNNRKWRAYQIWIRVRAYVRGRPVQQELDYLEEARGQIDTLWEEVMKFKADSETQLPEKILEIEKPDPAEQIELMVRKIEWCDCLYPSLKSLRTEKAHAASDELMDRIDSLLSWQTITKRLRTQIGILQKWTGSAELEVNQPGAEVTDSTTSAQPDQNQPRGMHLMPDTSPFIERIFKEDTLQKTFEKSTINDLYRLVHDAKSVMINCRHHFKEMNLPTFWADILHLVNFPTNLIQEALKMRLQSVHRLDSEQQPSVILVDQLTSDFRSGLQLAARMKENFLEIMKPNPDEGWPGAQLHEEYDQTLLDSLRFFFKLLNWKLKSGSKAIYLKETEIVENEWKFLSEAVEQIDGGDLLVGEHFWCVPQARVVGSERC